MLRIKTLSVPVILVFSLLSCGGIEEGQEKKEPSLEHLQWLVGTWQDLERKNQFEIWENGENGFYGVGIFVRGQDTSYFEQMSITLHDGNLAFVARVRENQGPIVFLAHHLSEGNVIFNNPQHDFPKTIRYSLIENGSVHTLLETEVGDGERNLVTRLVRK